MSTLEPHRRMRIPFLARFFTEHDAVDEALADLEHQGARSAHVAHLFAMLLVVLFSAGSLVALGGEAPQAVLAQWNRTHTLNIPSAITLSVSTLSALSW